MVKKSLVRYISATGRRRSAIVNVKIFPGKEESFVNNIEAQKYFPGSINSVKLKHPFILTNTQYYFHSKAVGGGIHSQLDALILAISRAIDKDQKNPDIHKILKDKKLLTVDSRVRERRKVGRGGKARRLKQSPKR